MAVYTYQSAVQLKQIAQTKMPRLTQDRPPFKWSPIEESNDFLLIWQQMDNYVGLQQIRGMGGDPPKVDPVAIREYSMTPGVFGEFSSIDEREMTTRAAMGTFGTPIDVSDLVLQRQDQLLSRRLDRVEQLLWTTYLTGTYSITGINGAVMATDTFPLQTFTAVVPWATTATATPLADMSAVQLLSRGYSVDMGSKATAYMNRQTFNDLRSNFNLGDLYGRRERYGATVNTRGDVNAFFTGDDLPNIVIYDQTYFDSNGNYQLFIPYKKVLVVGVRPAGQQIGAYRMVRNANNPASAPGPYMRVIDLGEFQVPRKLQVHDGHNGGVVIYFPSAFIVMNV